MESSTRARDPHTLAAAPACSACTLVHPSTARAPPFAAATHPAPPRPTPTPHSWPQLHNITPVGAGSASHPVYSGWCPRVSRPDFMFEYK